MARMHEPHEYDGSEDSADRADFVAWAHEVDEDEDTKEYVWHAPLQEPLNTWQDQQKAAQRERIAAELRRVMAEDSRSREFLNTGIQQGGPVHPADGIAEQQYEPDALMAQRQTAYRAVGKRSLRRSVARMMHRVADAIYQEAS